LQSENSNATNEQNLWGIVKGTEKSLTDPNKLLKWKNIDYKAKAIIGLSLSASKLHHIDMEKLSKLIASNGCKVFFEATVIQI